MVWVCPPHTSMNLYCRSGSHSAAIRVDNAWAKSPSRYSSTKRIRILLSDGGCRQGGQLLGVGVADVLQEPQSGLGLGFVDFGQCEPDMDQDPVAGLEVLVLEQTDIDGPAYAAHVHPGQVGLIGQDLQDLSRNTKAHGGHPPVVGTAPRGVSGCGWTWPSSGS